MYASVDSMIARFGETEMIRLTTPSGEPMTAVVAGPAEAALVYASSLIDTYLRKRYAVPLDLVPAEIERACLMIARHELSIGEQKTPSEETKDALKTTMDWLRDVATGKVELDLAEVPSGDDSYAMASTRCQVFR